MNPLLEQEIETLRQAANANGNAIYALPANLPNLEQNGFVVVNRDIVDPTTGSVAATVTQAGIDYLNTPPVAPVIADLAPQPLPEAPVADVSVPTGNFVVQEVAIEAPAAPVQEEPVTSGLVKGFVPPSRAIRRSSTGSGKYPFEKMELGDAYFVPATEKRPDPKKSLGSTISSANNRFKDLEPRRYFRTYRVLEGQICGTQKAPSDGAYIVREEPPVEE